MNILVNFVLNKNGRGRKKAITREKHQGDVTPGHKLAGLMKKRKEEILFNKEQFSVQPSVQSTIQSSVQPTVQSNYVYGIGILTVLAIGVRVFFHVQKEVRTSLPLTTYQTKKTSYALDVMIQ